MINIQFIPSPLARSSLVHLLVHNMVNTFIPYADFKKCAKVLDNRRLGKQRVEAKQIINILTNATKTTGWRQHPAVKMWEGYAPALMLYYNEIVYEWIARGFRNNMPVYAVHAAQPVQMPWFIGNRSVHLSHQANLIRKDPVYTKWFKQVPHAYIQLTYIWPSDLTDRQIKYLKVNKAKIINRNTLQFLK